MTTKTEFFEKNGYLHIKSFLSRKIISEMKSHAEILSKKNIEII